MCLVMFSSESLLFFLNLQRWIERKEVDKCKLEISAIYFHVFPPLGLVRVLFFHRSEIGVFCGFGIASNSKLLPPCLNFKEEANSFFRSFVSG